MPEIATAFVASLFIACQSAGPPGSAPLDPAVAADAGDDDARAESAVRVKPLRMRHSTWRGYSAGAGFHRTVWQVVEIDFVDRRIRANGASRDRRTVRSPRPHKPNMLENDWTKLCSEREEDLRRAVDAWLSSEPGRISAVFYSVGYEDAYTETFHLVTTNGEYTFLVNPQNFSGERTRGAPPTEYQNLRNAISAAVPPEWLRP